MKKPISFEIHHELPGTLGRAGTIHTPHGDIHTPAFVTVGTKATVKALTPEQVRDAGAQVVLANTYHLYLQPGDEKIKQWGGLHKAMNWSGPMMTDSGGFQVFSLGVALGNNIGKFSDKNKSRELLLPETFADLDDEEKRLLETMRAKIDPHGVMFRSHIDGSAHYITPQKSIEIQHNLGADIIFAFDECTSPHESVHYQTEALDRTHRWAKESLEYHTSQDNAGRQALFGIVQGGREEHLRRESARVLGAMDFDGYGIGGSFEKEDMSMAVRWCNEILPKDKPRHLLGIGEPADLFSAVENGCDLFDCVAPTRIARNGGVYTSQGKINLMNAEFRDDTAPINAGCTCYTCTHYTRAYLAHLFRAKEMLGATLASIHNLHFIISMVDGMRESIVRGDFFEYKKDFLGKYI